MSYKDNDITHNGWNEYGRLVLNELERLNTGQENNEKELSRLSNLISLLQKEIEQHRDVDEKTFKELAGHIKNISDELNTHLREVNEVWSPRQMQQVKNEVYNQKNKWMRVAGVVIALQIVMAIVLFIKEFI